MSAFRTIESWSSHFRYLIDLRDLDRGSPKEILLGPPAPLGSRIRPRIYTGAASFVCLGVLVGSVPGGVAPAGPSPSRLVPPHAGRCSHMHTPNPPRRVRWAPNRPHSRLQRAHIVPRPAYFGCPSTKTAHGTPNLSQGGRGTHTRIELGVTAFCDCCCWGGIMVLHTNPGSSRVKLAPLETPVRSI